MDIREKELTILHKVAGYISSHLELHEMLEHIIEIANDLTEADSCLIYFYDPENQKLILKSSMNPHPGILGQISMKIGEGLTGIAAKEKSPIVIEKGAFNDPRFKQFSDLPEDKYEAFLSVPMLFKDEIIGVINIQHKKPHVYEEYQVNLLFTIAKYLGSAVQTAITEDKVQKKNYMFDTLSRISRTIISEEYLKEILHLIVTMTAEVLNSKICSIMLLDEKKQELIIAATQSLSDEYKNKPNLKVGQSVSGQVLREKTSLVIPDVTKDSNYMYPEIAKKEGIVSMLAVPMMIKDRVIGVINSYTDTLHEFSVDEIKILQAISNQAAVAIENTRLNREIIKTKEDLETRKLIARAKGIIMKDLNVNENDAYKKLQKKSMDLRKSMKEIAEAVILASEMM